MAALFFLLLIGIIVIICSTAELIFYLAEDNDVDCW